MKRLPIIILILMLFGCSGVDITTDNTHAVLATLEVSSLNAGYEVCSIKDPTTRVEIDRALSNFYDLATTGELSQDAIRQLNETLTEHVIDRPTLIPSLLILMRLIDVDFNSEETVLDELRVIAPAYFEAIARGYNLGYALCPEEE